MLYLANSFSLQMLQETGKSINLKVEKLDITSAMEVISTGGFISAIGHQDIARIAGDILNVRILPNRISVKLKKSDYLLVAQYSGGRLPEGATELPPGGLIEFFLVSIV